MDRQARSAARSDSGNPISGTPAVLAQFHVMRMEEMKLVSKYFAVAVAMLAIALALTASAVAADAQHTSAGFAGPKANTGSVSHSIQSGRSVLTLSDDFVVPDTPDPHWQLVDSNGRVYLLDKLKVKSELGDKVKKEIVIPEFVPNVAKVQIYCAWAETVLGEASFASPVR
jgi:hypothetical protein